MKTLGEFIILRLHRGETDVLYRDACNGKPGFAAPPTTNEKRYSLWKMPHPTAVALLRTLVRRDCDDYFEIVDAVRYPTIRKTSSRIDPMLFSGNAGSKHP